MTEETKHITARLQVLEFLMIQANLADLFRHTDILLFVMYAQNVAEGVTTQYQRMSGNRIPGKRLSTDLLSH